MSDREYPLTPGQQRMWFLQHLDPADVSENLVTLRRLTGPLDPAAFRRALDLVIARHEPLRTSFAEVDGAPVQRVDDGARVPVALHDLRSEADPEAAAVRLAEHLGGQPYALEHGPLLRVGLYRTGESTHLLLLAAHHLVSDGWSIRLLLDELLAAYGATAAGRLPQLPPLPGGFGDHVMWQRARAEGPAADRAAAHWAAELAAPPGRGLPPGTAPLPGPAADGRAHWVRAEVDSAAAAALEAFARQRSCTPFMAWLALYQLLVARHTGQHDLVVGTPTAGRERRADEHLVGCFTAVLPLRADLGGQGGFAALLDRTRTTVTGALSHPQVPYERLLGALGTARAEGQRQLFRHWFNLHTESAAGAAPADTGPLRVEALPGAPAPTPFDTALDAWPDAGGALHLVLAYDPAVLDAGTAQALLDRLPVLARHALARPELPLGELSLLAPGEDGAPLSGPPGVLDDPETVLDLLLRQGARTPDAIALRDGERTFNYRELLAESHRAAAAVREVGALPRTPVGLYGPRSAELVTGMLGILLAGCAYLPLDPALPAARLRSMLHTAGATAVLTTPHTTPTDTGLPTAFLEPAPAPAPATLHHLPPAQPFSPASPSPADPAYVLFTSGSTGEPKAVAVSHRALLARVRWMGSAYGLGPGERVLQFASPGFDTHVEEIFPALSHGAEVVLLPVPSAELPDWLGGPQGRTLTVLDLPTAYWQELVAAGPAVPWPPALRTVVLGGDQVTADAVAVWRELFGDRVELWNTYGPTEATVIATAARLGAPDALARPGIGRPIAATVAHLLDDGRRPVPPGVPGELWLGGDGLADGYLGRPELTADRFVPDPFTGGRMYRTGDLARLRPDGALEFLGRLDRQLKVRGHRVEPAEVEAALLRHPGVARAVVDLSDEAGRQTLTAWVVPEAEQLLRPEELRQHLRALLPAHLVPDACVLLDRLPLTVRGKLDRAALPAPAGAAAPAAAERTAPRTDAEQLVAEVWAEVLGLDEGRVGVHDDFFALGGHSLLAVRVLARLRTALELDLPVRVLFTAPTVAGTAAAVEELLLAEIDALSEDEVRALIDGAVPTA
ncbi:non-ribosomal peptide synthetase [Streptomyces sp. TLI_171]|uniref:non-ribosomal peptide synthetase n=1 Tax=Streptomyces sp. TLI_171 TaxID=1938859 RepID=UPI000C17FEFD|nr:non-ribosomal peptide synthetase [Streptomyces sp. TLI_171]RKE21816.1 amino acid adenylation domain-containing protein [Streptomyces sp. TLI_171]